MTCNFVLNKKTNTDITSNSLKITLKMKKKLNIFLDLGVKDFICLLQMKYAFVLYKRYKHVIN